MFAEGAAFCFIISGYKLGLLVFDDWETICARKVYMTYTDFYEKWFTGDIVFMTHVWSYHNVYKAAFIWINVRVALRGRLDFMEQKSNPSSDAFLSYFSKYASKKITAIITENLFNR